MDALRLIAFILIGSFFLYSTYAYSSGAPLSQEICETLRPNHPGEPQSSKIPYKLRLSKRILSPGETITLSLYGRTSSFKGFLVQGRKLNYEKELSPVGIFPVGTESSDFQTINCGGIESSAVTHKNGQEKMNVTLSWKAPSEKGVYVLLTTIVQSGKIYWVAKASPSITVQ